MPKKFYKEENEAIPAIQFVSSQPVGFTEITNPNVIKNLYIRQYSYRINDGKEHVVSFTADRYIDVVNGTYTAAEVFSLETHIKDLYDQLNNGWWLTAQNTNSTLALTGIYDQAMKDSIQTILDDYVTENY